MNIIEFLLALIQGNVPLKESRFRDIEAKANAWQRLEIECKKEDGSIDKDKLQEQKNPIVKFLRQYGEQWYTQLGLAVLFIWATRWVNDFMHPSIEDKD
jgi:hypothetical protein